jgi:trimeric autotransporter adhesin
MIRRVEIPRYFLVAYWPIPGNNSSVIPWLMSRVQRFFFLRCLWSGSLLAVAFSVVVAGCGGGSGGGSSNPVETLSSVTPASVAAGTSGLTLTLSGSNFASNSTVQWNGTSLSTTYESATSLKANVPDNLLTAPGNASLTVQNASAGGMSSALKFSVIAPPQTTLTAVALAVSDFAWDATNQKIYAINAGDNTTSVIDPIAGTPGASVSTGSLGAVAVSDDGQYLYGGTGSTTTAENGDPIGGTTSVQRFLLPGLTPDILIPVFSESGLELLPPIVGSISVAPGASHTVMVSLASGRPELYPSSVVLYTDSTPGPHINPTIPLTGPQWFIASIAWGPDASTLYLGGSNALQTFTVMSSTVTQTGSYSNVFNYWTANDQIHFDKGTGYVYDDGGTVVDPKSGTVVGQYVTNFQNSQLGGQVMIPDSSTHRVFFLGQTSAQAGGQDYTLAVFDQQQFTQLGSMTIPNAAPTFDYVPQKLIRWGASGLAFSSGESLLLVDGGFVNPNATQDSSTGTIIKSNAIRTR